MLNPGSPLPLYQQLAELLGRSIEGGELAEGARLPSEPELSRRHRIGRPTVRQAIELLVRRGLVERRRGSGTYVRAPVRRIDLFSLGGTLSSFRQSGLELRHKLVGKPAIRRVPADPENPFSERQAFVLSRVSSVDAKPVLFERLFFDPEVFVRIDELPLAGASLSRLVEERYYLRPTHAEQSFRVEAPPADVCRALGLGARTELLLVKRTLFFPRVGRAIFCELFCKTDELVFVQSIGAEARHD